MSDDFDVPDAIVRRLRVACAHLPEAYEEKAFDFVRWRIRGRTLAQVRTKDRGHGRVTYLTFHSSGEELDVLIAMGDPFFPGWGSGLVAMVLREDGTTDWTEVQELLTESYCLLAPKKLVARLPSMRPDS
jgi:hypothetical protein